MTNGTWTTRRSAILGLGALAATPALIRSASAQAWAPARPVKLVVAYPAGGPTDGIARIVAQDLSTTLGQQVVVENVGGASGSIGTRQVAKADPDGHTITFGNNQTHGNNMFLLKEPGYDAVKDFAPLAGAGAFEHIFVVKNDLPVKTIPELIALAKSKPGELNYGSTGVGSGSHLSTELFMVRTGIKMTHVPYRGAAPLVQDIVGNRIDVANSTMASVFTQIQAGTLRGIAIGSPQRNAQLPNVPTLREQGVANADAESWTGFFAPAATPQPALDRLSREILAALGKPAVVEAITKLGFTITARDPAAFRPYHAQEMQTWAEIIRAANIQPAG
ncbi:MAG: tripartite tricarboxylate transporter substrate binding protein [Phreatobacter sp.]|jgi:tripartite-type tricarboxylate transporter receptor subunit TctC|nr:tripartite tricarboxylate transporter substrate binding protein [Phreatobacter sp.]